MSGYFIKAQEAQTEYAIDWAKRHLRDGELVAEDLGWSIVPQQDPPAGLETLAMWSSGSMTGLTVGAGTPGLVYVLTGTILTTDNRVVSHAVALRISGETLTGAET